MSTCPYTLPSFTFVGGSSKIISIELHNSGGAPFPVGSDVTVTFVLGSFLDDGPAVLTLSSGSVDPRITVTTGDLSSDWNRTTRSICAGGTRIR